jgi:hypothetical protein
MKIARLASLVLVAVLAVGLAVVPVASAAPEFKPTGSTVTGVGTTTAVLIAAGETITCAKNVVSGGVVTSATLVGGIVVHFLECTTKTAGGETCAAMSTGAPLENLILTTTLHGVLGLILPKPAEGSGVALILLPVSGSSFVQLLGKCFVTTNVSGQVAGVAEPIGSSVTKGTLKFNAPGGVQEIKEVDLSTGGLVKPKLTAFSATASQTVQEAITFGTATEIT